MLTKLTLGEILKNLQLANGYKKHRAISKCCEYSKDHTQWLRKWQEESRRYFQYE